MENAVSELVSRSGSRNEDGVGKRMVIPFISEDYQFGWSSVEEEGG